MNYPGKFGSICLPKTTTPSLEFFKRTLGTTLAIVLAWLLSVRPGQAGYIVKLQQVGPNVVANGSGAIDLTGATFSQSTSVNPGIIPHGEGFAFIYTGPTSSSVDLYVEPSGPNSFGPDPFTRSASSGSGDMVGIGASGLFGNFLIVPRGYVSGTLLSDSATYSAKMSGTLSGFNFSSASSMNSVRVGNIHSVFFCAGDGNSVLMGGTADELDRGCLLTKQACRWFGSSFSAPGVRLT
jgi:hypothetical protein